jgi:RimJ/RimL family protein N-acetyltransferase
VAIVLRTPRLLLREWRDEDREAFAAMSADPDVMALLPPLADRAASDAWVDRRRQHQAEHGFSYWAVEIPGEAPFIGAIGLSWVSLAANSAPVVEVAWRLVRQYWSKGYATEAARAAIDDGFGRLGLDEIVAFTVPMNQASQRVMQRLGMTRDPAEDFDFDHPRLPVGHPLRRQVLYRIRR